MLRINAVFGLGFRAAISFAAPRLESLQRKVNHTFNHRAWGLGFRAWGLGVWG